MKKIFDRFMKQLKKCIKWYFEKSSKNPYLWLTTGSTPTDIYKMR